MVQAINEVKTDGNVGIGIVADGAGATYFGTDPRIESITSSYNTARLATRVYTRKFRKTGRPYPAFTNDLNKLLSSYSSCMKQIIKLDSAAISPDECDFVLEL